MSLGGELFKHIWVSVYETLIAFGVATGLGILLAILLWWSEYLRKILEPYIVTLNSLPKISLGPIIIIWMGVGSKAIITMANTTFLPHFLKKMTFFTLFACQSPILGVYSRRSH